MTVIIICNLKVKIMFLVWISFSFYQFTPDSKIADPYIFIWVCVIIKPDHFFLLPWTPKGRSFICHSDGPNDQKLGVVNNSQVTFYLNTNNCEMFTPMTLSCYGELFITDPIRNPWPQSWLPKALKQTGL